MSNLAQRHLRSPEHVPIPDIDLPEGWVRTGYGYVKRGVGGVGPKNYNNGVVSGTWCGYSQPCVEGPNVFSGDDPVALMAELDRVVAAHLRRYPPVTEIGTHSATHGRVHTRSRNAADD